MDPCRVHPHGPPSLPLVVVAAAPKTAGLLDAEGQQVGEVDGQSFGIGVAPYSAKPSSSLSTRKSKSRKAKDHASPTSRREGIGSPVTGKELESLSPSKTNLLSVSTKELDGKEATAKEQQDTASIDTHRSESVAKEEHSRPR
ncbi:hypothetical protein FKM82_026375 [Ascaphus truei]